MTGERIEFDQDGIVTKLGDGPRLPWEPDQFCDALVTAFLSVAGWEAQTFAEAGVAQPTSTFRATPEGLVVRTPRGTFHLTITRAEP